MFIDRAKALEIYNKMSKDEKIALWRETGLKFTFPMFNSSSLLIQQALNKRVSK